MVMVSVDCLLFRAIGEYEQNLCYFQLSWLFVHYLPMTIKRPASHQTSGFKGAMNMKVVVTAKRVQKVIINFLDDRPWSAKAEVPRETIMVHQTETTLMRST